MIPRWIAPVLVVVFALVTVWAGYNLSSQLSAPRPSSSTTPVLTFEGSGSYFYVATLAPNDLYNSTTVSGTNLTLFAPITRWVNVTFVDGVTLDSPAAAQLVDHFSVTLSTPAWSKTIDQGVQENSSANSTSLRVVDRYDLNVSWAENLTQTIDAQLGYSPSQFTVTLAPTVAGDITIGSEVAPLSMSPLLNLTFAGTLITPKGGFANVQDKIYSSNGSVDAAGGGAVTEAYLYLAVSLSALAVSIGLLWATRRSTRSSALPDLETLIEPYEEVIARTSREPQASMIFPVEQFEDLVKVSDTLGRPILRLVGRADDPSGTSFYVVDGTIAYRYGYPSTGSRPEEGLAPTSEPTGTDTSLPKGLSPPVSAGSDTAQSSTAHPAGSSTIAENSKWLAADQLKADIAWIQSAKLSPTERARALDLVRETARSVRSARPSEVHGILEEFHRTLNSYLREPPPSR